MKYMFVFISVFQLYSAAHEEFSITPFEFRSSIASKSLSAFSTAEEAKQRHQHRRTRSRSNNDLVTAASSEQVTPSTLAASSSTWTTTIPHAAVGAHRMRAVTLTATPCSTPDRAREQELMQLREDNATLTERLERWQERNKTLEEGAITKAEVLGLQLESCSAAIASTSATMMALRGGDIQKNLDKLLQEMRTIHMHINERIDHVLAKLEANEAATAMLLDRHATIASQHETLLKTMKKLKKSLDRKAPKTHDVPIITAEKPSMLERVKSVYMSPR